MARSGVAHAVGAGLIELCAPLGPVGVLAALFVATATAATIVGNNAAAALMYPIAAAAATQANLPLRPCLIVLMLAASASFSTPIGYQTNLMVLGPGGYRFGDFFRIGIHLQLLVGIVTVTIAWWLWL